MGNNCCTPSEKESNYEVQRWPVDMPMTSKRHPARLSLDECICTDIADSPATAECLHHAASDPPGSRISKRRFSLALESPLPTPASRDSSFFGSDHSVKGLDDSSYEIDTDHAKLSVLFDCIDADSDGKISTNDMLLCMAAVDSDMVSSEAELDQLHLKLKELVVQYSSNDKGFWTRDEFVRFMRDCATISRPTD